MATSTRSTTQRLACLDSLAEDCKIKSTGSVGSFAGNTHTSAIDRVDRLRRTIESEIIPRLMLKSRSHPASLGVSNAPDVRISPDEVVGLTDLLLAGSTAAAMDFVAGIVERGVTRPAILLDLLAPVAKRLGELWETDECSFADVTIAMGTLQQALRVFKSDYQPKDMQRSILLAPATGEQHTFPLHILECIFQRAGWAVECDIGRDAKRTCTTLRQQHFEAIGLSISRDSLIDQLSSDIQCFRRASRNKSIVVLVGGRVFTGKPELVARVGADATAENAPLAVNVAEALVPVAISVYR